MTLDTSPPVQSELDEVAVLLYRKTYANYKFIVCDEPRVIELLDKFNRFNAWLHESADPTDTDPNVGPIYVFGVPPRVVLDLFKRRSVIVFDVLEKPLLILSPSRLARDLMLSDVRRATILTFGNPPNPEARP